MRKTLLVVGVISAIGVAGFIGYQLTQRAEMRSRLQEAIGRDLGTTETLLKLESEPGRITFQEIFDLYEKAIERRTTLIIDLRGLYPTIGSEIKEHLIGYLTAENNLARSKKTMYRHLATYQASLRSFRDTGAAQELLQESQRYPLAYRNLISREADIAQELGAHGIQFRMLYKQYEPAQISFAQALEQKADLVLNPVSP